MKHLLVHSISIALLQMYVQRHPVLLSCNTYFFNEFSCNLLDFHSANRQMQLLKDNGKLALLLHSMVREGPEENLVLSLAFQGGDTGRYNLTWVIAQQQHDTATKEREFVHYARECCECLKALHEMNIVHGNVNPANFVLVSPRDSMDDSLRLVSSSSGMHVILPRVKRKLS